MAQSNKMHKETFVNITSATILKVVLIIAAIAVLYFLRSIIGFVFIALLIAVVIDPLVDFLVKKKVPRSLSVSLIFLLAFVVIVGTFILVIPNVLQELTDLLTQYSSVIESASAGTINVQLILEEGLVAQNIEDLISTVRNVGLSDALPDVLNVFANIFTGIITLILIIFLSFYMIVEEKDLHEKVVLITPKKYKTLLKKILPQIREKIGYWVRGQLILSITISIVTYVMLSILDIPFALVLALLVGVLDIIPFVGAIIAFFPILIIAFSASPMQAVFASITYLVIQQIHGDILTPKVMQKVAGLNPVITIVALLIGFEIGGVMGAILAIPAAMIIGVVIGAWSKSVKKSYAS